MAEFIKVCSRHPEKHPTYPGSSRATKCRCGAPLQTVMVQPPAAAQAPAAAVAHAPQEVVIRVDTGQGGGDRHAREEYEEEPEPARRGGGRKTVFIAVMGIMVLFAVFSIVIGKTGVPIVQPGGRGREELKLEEQGTAQAAEASGGVGISMQGGVLMTPGGQTKVVDIVTFKDWDWKRFAEPAMNQFMLSVVFIVLLAIGDGFTNRLGKNKRTVWSLIALIATLVLVSGWMIFLGMIFTCWVTLRAKEAPQTGEIVMIGLVIAMFAFIAYQFGPAWLGPETGNFIRLVLTAGKEWRWLAWVPLVIGFPLAFIKAIDGTDYGRNLAIIAALAIATTHMPFLEDQLSGPIQTIGDLNNGLSIVVYILLLGAILITMKELWNSMTINYGEEATKVRMPPVVGAIAYLFIVLAVGNFSARAIAAIASPLHILPPAEQWAVSVKMMLAATLPVGFFLHLVSEGGRVGQISYAIFKAVLGDCWHFSIGGDEEEAGFFGFLLGADAIILFLEVGLFILVGFPVLRGIFGISAG